MTANVTLETVNTKHPHTHPPRPGHIPMWPVAAIVALAYVSWLMWHLTQN